MDRTDRTAVSTHKLCNELSPKWPLFSRPADYDVDADCAWKLLTIALRQYDRV